MVKDGMFDQAQGQARWAQWRRGFEALRLGIKDPPLPRPE